MKSVQKSFMLLMVAGVTLVGLDAWSAPIARILRAGNGRVHVAYAWPERYKIPSPSADKKYSVRRLLESEYPRVSKAVRATWNSRHFTDLSTLAVGTELENFQVVVHGLELKALQKSLTNMSFDDFIAGQLNASVPTGIEFVRYYPYFFHKKTVISASIVNAFNTATFGDSGFILTVPADNYLGCSTVDMHTPTDRDFYRLKEFTESKGAGSSVGGSGASAAAASSSAGGGGAAAASVSSGKATTGAGLAEAYARSVGDLEPHGPRMMRELYASHPLVALSEFLPKSKVETGGTSCKKREASAADAEEQALLKLLISSFGGAETEDVLSRVGTQSWYNEIAISPVSPRGESVELTGVFLRTANTARALELLMAKPEVRILLELAEVYNLPVLHIYDGQYYETDVGE